MHLVYPRLWLTRLRERYEHWEAWLDELPSIVQRLTDDWDLELGAWLASGVSHAVWRVESGGRAAVLKVSRPDLTMTAQASALAAYWSTGAPTPAPLRVSEDGRALLTRYVNGAAPTMVSVDDAMQLLEALSSSSAGSIALDAYVRGWERRARFAGDGERWDLINAALPTLLEAPSTLLHGRLDRRHLLTVDGRLHAISPLGLDGPRAYDCASITWADEGHHPSSILALAAGADVPLSHVHGWIAIQTACAELAGLRAADAQWLTTHQLHLRALAK